MYIIVQIQKTLGVISSNILTLKYLFLFIPILRQGILTMRTIKHINITIFEDFGQDATGSTKKNTRLKRDYKIVVFTQFP